MGNFDGEFYWFEWFSCHPDQRSQSAVVEFVQQIADDLKISPPSIAWFQLANPEEAKSVHRAAIGQNRHLEWSQEDDPTKYPW